MRAGQETCPEVVSLRVPALVKSIYRLGLPRIHST
jgi:hypothetical protein